MAYQIWLGNPYELHFDWNKLCAEVVKLFRPVIVEYDSRQKVKSRRFGTVRCSSRIERPQVGARDLLVYVVPEPQFGFVGVEFGTGGREIAGGLTLTDHVTVSGRRVRQVASEVSLSGGQIATGPGATLRVDRLSTTPPTIRVDKKRSVGTVARVIFHEALHNRTGMGNRALHTHPGVRLGEEFVPTTGMPSKADIRLMADHLTNPIGQWTGGWAALDARWGKRPANKKKHLQNP
ncbi:MAG: hypothetical protein KC587_14530 [Nitrospira sp.]|nr:hypothetical protein [Nitrospira sp.]MCA9457878.1 hypothetical protein [Nitrospira sp.]MCW5785785.1 hypothetical protein [Nitrospirales bacterium]